MNRANRRSLRQLLDQLLNPQVFRDDLEKQRQAAFLQLILLICGAAAVLYLLASILGGTLPGTALYVVPLLIGLVVLQGMSRAGYPRLASWGLVIGLFALLGHSSGTTGGARSPAYFVFVDLILIAGALLGTRVAVALGLFSAVLGGGFLVFEAVGIYSFSQELLQPAVYFVSMQLVILSAWFVVRLSDRDLRVALDRASSEIQERKTVQRKLGYRLELGDLLASLSAAFVSAGDSSSDELVDFALSELRSFLGAGVCLLETLSTTNGSAGTGKLWSTAGPSPETARGLLAALVSDPELNTEVALGHPVVVKRDDRESAATDLWSRLEPWMGGLQAALVVPVPSVTSGEGVLILGFESQDVPLEEDVLTQVRALAEIMVNGLNRIRVEHALRRSLDELEHAENLTYELDARYKQLFRDSADAVYISERDGTIVEFNPAAYSLFAIPEWEQEDLNAGDLYAAGDDRKKLQGAMEADGYIQDYPVKLRARDGRLLDCLITASVRRDSQGQVVGYQGIIRDVSDERQRQELMDLQVRRLEALNRIGQAISGSTDPRLTYGVLLSEVSSLLQVDAADVLVSEEATGVLVFGAAKGFYTDALRHSQLRPGEGLAGSAALEQTEVFIPDLKQTTSFDRSPHFAQEGFVSYCGLPLLAKGRVGGVLELFTRRPLVPTESWWESARAFASQAAVAMDSANLFVELERSNLDLVRAYDATLEGWAKAHDLRDHETVGHSKRVAQVAVRLGSALGVPGKSLVNIYRGALLHDIGKLAIPDSILRKPGKLNDDEWALMRQHPTLAYELLKGIPYLVPALDIPRYHHEHWDGNGYPDQLRGETIPLSARIFAVVDVWDALRSNRPYRDAWPLDQVLAYLKERRGAQFDPEVVDAFLGIIEEVEGPHG
jgi:PAS domain S-box-containing protein